VEKAGEHVGEQFCRHVAVDGTPLGRRAIYLTSRAGPHRFQLYLAPPLGPPWVGFGLGVPDNKMGRGGAKEIGGGA
jgi:hypothetical protein